MKKLLFLIIFFSIPAVAMAMSGDLSAKALAKVEAEERRRNDTTEMLFEAVEENNTAKAQKALENGASANQKGEWGITPLCFAVNRDAVSVIKLLFEKGANPNILTDTGETPLHAAVKHCNYNLAELLIEHGAHADLENGWGETSINLSRRKYGENSALHKLLVEEVRKRKRSLVKGIAI